MSSSDVQSMGGVFAAFGIMWVICLAIGIFSIVCMWKVYEKAGKPGWASIIPVYNVWVLFQITWGENKGVMCFLMLIPFVNFILAIITLYKLAQVFDGDIGIFLLLLLVSPVGWAILAFNSEAEYIGVAE